MTDSRFLITTALETTWKEGEPVLFLGSWCQLYSRRERWSKMNAEVLPWHWDDPRQLLDDYKFVCGLYERYLVALAEKLNRTHNVVYPLRYWRILVGPWLAYFIQILFDRWRSIERAVNEYQLSGTILLAGQDNIAVPNDATQFGQQIFTDEWNHYIYGRILEHFTDVPIVSSSSAEKSTTPEEPRRIGLKQSIVSAYARVARGLARTTDVFTIDTVLPVTDEVRLQLRLRQVPQFWHAVPAVSVPIDWGQRNWKLADGADKTFEALVSRLVPRLIPVVLLEGYQHLRDQVNDLPWPRRPKAIFSAAGLWHDTVTAAYSAEKVNEGSRLVCAQHGGVYGIAKFTWAEEHEIDISDRFLTWGWDDKSQPTVVPLGMLRRRKHRRRAPNDGESLLLVMCDASRYSYWLSSDSWYFRPKYTEECLNFAAALRDDARRKLLVRHTASDLGWNQAARWEDRFPEVARDAGLAGMKDLLFNARIAVYTYNSTGFLEAFVADIPAVLFWDPDLSPLRESACPYFAELKSVGIFHESGASAARHVTAVWDDVEGWWFSPAVRQALKRFNLRYCYAPKNLPARLEAALRSVIREKDSGVTRSCDQSPPIHWAG